jgi:hypothetical protein
VATEALQLQLRKRALAAALRRTAALGESALFDSGGGGSASAPFPYARAATEDDQAASFVARARSAPVGRHNVNH